MRRINQCGVTIFALGISLTTHLAAAPSLVLPELPLMKTIQEQIAARCAASGQPMATILAKTLTKDGAVLQVKRDDGTTGQILVAGQLAAAYVGETGSKICESQSQPQQPVFTTGQVNQASQIQNQNPAQTNTIQPINSQPRRTSVNGGQSPTVGVNGTPLN